MFWSAMVALIHKIAFSFEVRDRDVVDRNVFVVKVIRLDRLYQKLVN